MATTLSTMFLGWNVSGPATFQYSARSSEFQPHSCPDRNRHGTHAALTLATIRAFSRINLCWSTGQSTLSCPRDPNSLVNQGAPAQCGAGSLDGFAPQTFSMSTILVYMFLLTMRPKGLFPRESWKFHCRLFNVFEPSTALHFDSFMRI